MNSPGGKTTRIVKLLRKSDLNALGKVLHCRVKVAVDVSHIWIRYDSDDERVASVAACINGRHFQLLESNLLVPLGSAVATERLPELEWRDLERVLELKLPSAALPGRLAAAGLPELKLLRGGAERPAAAGLYPLEAFLNWVVTAPQFRIQKLMACTSEQEILVIGNPLPPLECEFLCQEGRLFTPAGMTWYPRIDAEQVLEYFDVAEDEILLWTHSDQFWSVPIEFVKPLRRGSIRALVDQQNTEC